MNQDAFKMQMKANKIERSLKENLKSLLIQEVCTKEFLFYAVFSVVQQEKVKGESARETES